MRKELEESLINDFPLLYRGFSGFSISDGWEPLVRELSSKLESLINDLNSSNDDAPKVLQVKEKFGGLRFYMSYTTDEMWELIKEAEQKSLQICEECGDPGSLTITNNCWRRTLDEKCKKLFK